MNKKQASFDCVIAQSEEAFIIHIMIHFLHIIIL